MPLQIITRSNGNALKSIKVSECGSQCEPWEGTKVQITIPVSFRGPPTIISEVPDKQKGCKMIFCIVDDC